MGRKIQLKRGTKANLPQLAPGEIGFVTDENNVYIGSDDGNVLIGGDELFTQLSTALQTVDKTKTDLQSHLIDTVKHITSAERTKWNNMLPVTNSEYNTDPNTTVAPHILTNHGNSPIGSRFWYILTFFFNVVSVNSNRTQIAIDYSTSNLAYRSYRDGVWSTWTIIGTGSTLKTVDKTVVGAINEVSDKVTGLNEKGTWTPILRGSLTAGSPTYTVREGDYVRNGNSVYVRGRVEVSSQNDMYGNLEIGGLPFLTGGSYRVATIGVHNNITHPYESKGLSGYIESNVMRPYFNIDGSSGLVRVTTNDALDSFMLTFSATYDI